jgi:hypothetical protein
MAAHAATQNPTQASMRDIFEALSIAFIPSLNEQQFQAPANRQRIRKALGALAEHAAQIESHGQGVVPRFDFLRRSLVRDAQGALQRYERGEYQAAQFILHQLTQNCFACHAKLPSPQPSTLGKPFLETAQIADLSLQERARLAVATRQFDTALETYEALFRSPMLTAGEISLMGAFEDYLKIAIRVRGDFERAMATLQTFRQRSDLPQYLTEYMVNWVEALHELRFRQDQGEAVSRARALIQEAQLRNRFPVDRLGLVHFVVASSLLQRFIDADPVNQAQLAEAYYLLGVAESHISRSLWVSETEFFLETAIRLSPRSPYARKAYAFLEEYVLTGYTGSAGLHLPEDVRTHLEELRRLVGNPQR